MKVRVLTPLSHNNEWFKPGEVLEMNDDDARPLLKDRHPVIEEVDPSTPAVPEPQPDGKPLMENGAKNPDKKAGAFNKGEHSITPPADTDQPAASDASAAPADTTPVDQQPTQDQVTDQPKTGKFS